MQNLCTWTGAAWRLQESSFRPRRTRLKEGGRAVRQRTIEARYIEEGRGWDGELSPVNVLTKASSQKKSKEKNTEFFTLNLCWLIGCVSLSWPSPCRRGRCCLHGELSAWDLCKAPCSHGPAGRRSGCWYTTCLTTPIPPTTSAAASLSCACLQCVAACSVFVQVNI